MSAENVIYLSSLGLYLSWYLPINIQCFTTGKLLDENEKPKIYRNRKQMQNDAEMEKSTTSKMFDFDQIA